MRMLFLENEYYKLFFVIILICAKVIQINKKLQKKFLVSKQMKTGNYVFLFVSKASSTVFNAVHI